MMKKTILAFGEVLWDMLPSCTILGGAPFNFAYRANSLGDVGLMISRLGRDELGRKAHEQIVRLGLDTKFIQWDDQFPTGTVEVSFDEQNNPDYFITPQVAYDQIELTDALVGVASIADCLCFGTLSQRLGKSGKTIEQLLNGASKSLKLLDINLRKDCYNLEIVTFSLQEADNLKLNEEEAGQLGLMLGIRHQSIPQFCEEMLERWSLRHCVVTLGEKGAFAMSTKGEKVYVSGYKIRLVDSLGAGDAFTAGFLHYILQQRPLAEACRFGNILGAIVCTQKGATQPVTLEQIDTFTNKDIERILDRRFEDFLN
jgi:fructokinase